MVFERYSRRRRRGGCASSGAGIIERTRIDVQFCGPGEARNRRVRVVGNSAAPRRRRNRHAVAAVLGAVLVGVMTFVTACSGASGAGGAEEVPIDSNPLAALIKPTVSASVVDGGVGFSPIEPVTVSVVNGKLESVTLLNPDGEPVAGALGPDGATWANTEPLGYSRQYRLEAVAYGLGGATTTVVSAV